MNTDNILTEINELTGYERAYVRAIMEMNYYTDKVASVRLAFRRALVPNTAVAVAEARSLLLDAVESGDRETERLLRAAALALLGAVVEGDY